MEEERLIAGEMQSEDMEIETSLRVRARCASISASKR